MVDSPTNMLVHQNPAKNGKFNAFIEMETHEKAAELLKQITNQKSEFRAFWANDPTLKSANQVNKTINFVGRLFFTI